MPYTIKSKLFIIAPVIISLGTIFAMCLIDHNNATAHNILRGILCLNIIAMFYMLLQNTRYIQDIMSSKNDVLQEDTHLEVNTLKDYVQYLVSIYHKYNELTLLNDAMNRSQAVIEFYPDGTIIQANENFCNATGYKLEEIQGQHHRIFCDPAYVASQEYKVFWQSLASGEFNQDEFQRFGKNGEEIWIQASYNPICDTDGKVIRVVKYASDITQQKTTNINFSEQMAAINRSQAVIEFYPDGTIIQANENFCNATGYKLEEIQGQHHRIFCDPAYADSQDYKIFWQNLASGEFNQDEFQRFGKNGEEIWIQASYNPIRGGDGKVKRVIKYASDITATIMERRNNDEIIMSASSALEKISDGDLTLSMEVNSQSDLSRIQSSVNNTVKKLSGIIASIAKVSQAIHSASHDITEGANDLSYRTEAQAASIEETVATMEQMSTSVRNNANSAIQASNLATDTLGKAEEGKVVVEQVIMAMENLENSSHRIAEIVSVIDSIASQTNLLALNAAVEAARAGTSGKGFAVVASEVRTLASRCSDAAYDIRGLISGSNTQVSEGVKLVNTAGISLRHIVESMTGVSEMITSISDASREQATGVEEISGAIAQMDEMTQKNASLSDKSASSARSLNGEVGQLSDLVHNFKIA